MEHVILPDNLKDDVCKLARNYSKNKQSPEKALIDEFYGYGTGLTFLFHGPSGTGKTMLAHALANRLDKELLTVDVEKAENLRVSFEDLIKHVFREAKLCDGIVFFDKCDDVFEADSDQNRTLLIEIEKTGCITILATNKVVELDPALDRRITMKVPFHLPGEAQREMIWNALVPPNIMIGKDVNFKHLARDYIFTGGLIKNTLFMAITNAMKKNGDSKVTLTSEEIECSADYQAASMFEANGFGKIYTPEISIEQLPLRPRDKKMLRKLTSAYKGLNDKDIGMRLIVGSSDIRTGIDCVDAIAKECQLKVKRFSFTDVLFGSDSSKVVKDPFTQKEMTALDYAFRTCTGRQSLTLFVDHASFFERFLSKDQENPAKELTGFFDRLQDFQGMLLLVTKPLKKRHFPMEFDYCLEINLPTEDLQIRRWEAHIKDNTSIESKLVDLVERYPLHLHEIDIVARKAHISAFLGGRNGTATIEHVYDVIKRLKNMTDIPILFGKRHDGTGIRRPRRDRTNTQHPA